MLNSLASTFFGDHGRIASGNFRLVSNGDGAPQLEARRYFHSADNDRANAFIKSLVQKAYGEPGEPKALYDDMYCQRGEAENRIKEAQVGLFATRTSCRHFQSNQLRVLLAALGYVLIERLRALALQGTALANAQVDTLRIKLLKVAAVVTRNTRRIRLYLASNWPSADIFSHAMSQLRSP
jgi:hypothetical protein